MNPDGGKNQNTSNDVPNVDPTQQAVFTPTPTPEPPRPSQNSSATVGSVVEPATTGLSHPYLSNHPTQSFASGVGDVVIGKGRKSKIGHGKRRFVVVAIVLVLVVLVGIGVANVARGNTREEMEASFQSYASYLLYEDPNNDDWIETDQSGNYMTMSEYALYQNFYSTDHTVYFNALDTFFDKFVTSYNRVRKKLGVETEFIDQYINSYRALSIISRTPTVEYVAVQHLFMESGEDGLLAWAENNFSELNKLEAGRGYYDSVITYVELIASGANNPDIWIELDDLQNQLILGQSYLVNSLQQGCWKIWNIFTEQNNA